MTADLSALLDQLRRRASVVGWTLLDGEEVAAFIAVVEATRHVKPLETPAALSDSRERLRRVLAGEEKS